MNCRHCGQKLGLMNRWRSANFCSKECKQAFDDEETRLTQQIVADFRKTAKPGEKKASTLPAASEPAPVVVEIRTEEEDPAPPMTGFLPQGDSNPVDSRPQRAAQAPTALTRKARVAWKELAQQVEGRLTGGTQIAAELVQLSRAISVDSDDEKGSFLRATARPVLAPEIRAPRLKTDLPLAGLQAAVKPQFHVPSRKLPDPGLPLMSGLGTAEALPVWESTPVVGSMVMRELDAPEQMIAVTPPSVSEAVPPGAFWGLPQEAWTVQPQVSWTDLAWAAIRMTGDLDPYDILPQASPAPFGGGAVGPALPHPAMGHGWPAPPPRPSVIAAPPGAGMIPAAPAGIPGGMPAGAQGGIMAAAPWVPSPGVHGSVPGSPQPAAGPAGPGVAGVPRVSGPPKPPGPPVWAQTYSNVAGWNVGAGVAPGAGFRIAYPQASGAPAAPGGGALPSQVPVMSLADLLVPEFAPAILLWPKIRNYPHALREEPRGAGRRTHLQQTVLPAAAGRPVDADLRLGPTQPVGCWEARTAPSFVLAQPGRVDSEHFRELPVHRWMLDMPSPEPGRRMGMGMPPKSAITGLRRSELRPERHLPAAEVPRRQICVWQRPGFEARACRTEVRVRLLEAPGHRTILPAEAAR